MEGQPVASSILFFGAGGRVVICSLCSARWENMAQEYIEVDLNEDDQRVDPLDLPDHKMAQGDICGFLRETVEKAMDKQGLNATAMTVALDEGERGVAQISVGWHKK